MWAVGLDERGPGDLFSLDLATEPVVLVLGAEGRGLSRLARERCDVLVRIPMLGRLPSLNVATAASLAVYEVARRRQALCHGGCLAPRTSSGGWVSFGAPGHFRGDCTNMSEFWGDKKE